MLLTSDIEKVIDHLTDRVLVVNIGGQSVGLEQRVEFLGQKTDIEDHQAVIV